MGLLTTSILVSIMPKADGNKWVKVLNDAMDRFFINTPYRAAAFLAQAAHESGELCCLAENLYYSASRLMQVFPKRFPTLGKAKLYEKNPGKLANYIYADRLGNGNEASGDGWKYRGRGIFQLTGRGNYREVGKGLNIDLENNPISVEEPPNAALTAAYFWKSHGLNELADDQNNDNDDEDFVTISIKINGGRVGLADRQAYWKKAKAAFNIK